MKKNKKNILVSLMLCILIVIFAGNYFRTEQTKIIDTEGQEWMGKKNNSAQKKSESIAIPGFESMTFIKNQSHQSVNFYNPNVNNCYFKLSLLLPDGVQIWESKYIEPGNGIYEIDLDNLLEEGEYEGAILKYQCYTMDEKQSPLNGSEIKFKLNVI